MIYTVVGRFNRYVDFIIEYGLSENHRFDSYQRQILLGIHAATYIIVNCDLLRKLYLKHEN